MSQRIYNVDITRVPVENLNYRVFKSTNISSYSLYIKAKIYNIKSNTLTKQITNHGTVPSPPIKIDLRSKCPPIYDQGQLGSCTANALCGAVQYEKMSLQGSRLFVYYNERMLENTIPYDAGAYLSDGVKTLQKYGVCPESEWPYDITKFAVKPPQKCYTDALLNTATKVANIQNTLSAMKNSLINGFPFVVGIAVYTSFESQAVANTGIVPMPKPRERLLGGHAVMCVGYDDSKQLWIMRNSWGTNWGDKGYFYLPYAYLTNSSYSSDLWNIQIIS